MTVDDLLGFIRQAICMSPKQRQEWITDYMAKTRPGEVPPTPFKGREVRDVEVYILGTYDVISNEGLDDLASVEPFRDGIRAKGGGSMDRVMGIPYIQGACFLSTNQPAKFSAQQWNTDIADKFCIIDVLPGQEPSGREYREMQADFRKNITYAVVKIVSVACALVDSDAVLRAMGQLNLKDSSWILDQVLRIIDEFGFTRQRILMQKHTQCWQDPWYAKVLDLKDAALHDLHDQFVWERITGMELTQARTGRLLFLLFITARPRVNAELRLAIGASPDPAGGLEVLCQIEAVAGTSHSLNGCTPEELEMLTHVICEEPEFMLSLVEAVRESRRQIGVLGGAASAEARKEFFEELEDSTENTTIIALLKERWWWGAVSVNKQCDMWVAAATENLSSLEAIFDANEEEQSRVAALGGEESAASRTLTFDSIVESADAPEFQVELRKGLGEWWGGGGGAAIEALAKAAAEGDQAGAKAIFDANKEDQKRVVELSAQRLEGVKMTITCAAEEGSELQVVLKEALGGWFGPMSDEVADELLAAAVNGDLPEAQRLIGINQAHQRVVGLKGGVNPASGFFGVQKEPGGRWRSRIYIEGVPMHIGMFDTDTEAACAYNAQLGKALEEERLGHGAWLGNRVPNEVDVGEYKLLLEGKEMRAEKKAEKKAEAETK